MDSEEGLQENASADDASKGRDETQPAGMREIIIRFASIGNFAMQIINIVMASMPSPLNPSFSDLTTTKKVGRGMLYGSSGLGVVHSPAVVYKERQLTKEDTFRAALNGIREEQGRLTEQNDVLSAEIDGLQSEVDRMKDVEMALRELSETQGSQLNELMDLIAENKEINESLRAVLKSKVLEEVVGLVLDIDNDGSFTIQDKEIDRLIIGMKLIEDINFCEDMFRKDVSTCGGNVDEVICLIKNMLEGKEGCHCTIDLEKDPDDFFKKERQSRGKTS